MEDTPRLDEIRHELVEIHDELLELPADAYDERSRLRDRQNELRQMSHDILDSQTHHDAEHLRSAYKRLEHLRDKMLDEQLSGASVGDDAVWGELAMAVNRAIDAGNGVDDVEAQLQEIVNRLRTAD